jgi:hypothetical protein
MRSALFILLLITMLAGCSTLTSRSAFSGFYRAHSGALDPAAYLLWLRSDGNFQLVCIPEIDATEKSDLRIPGDERGRWSVKGGRPTLKTQKVSWDPHLSVPKSVANIEGTNLRLRGMLFVREEEEPNQMPVPMSGLRPAMAHR